MNAENIPCLIKSVCSSNAILIFDIRLVLTNTYNYYRLFWFAGETRMKEQI